MHTKQVALFVLLALTVVSQAAFSAPAEKPRNERVVKDGLMVSLEYTLKSPDGKIIETSKGKEPLKYIHGQRMMIPGLERELSGMKVGGEKHVTVKPEDAYGKVDPNAVQEFPKDQIPPNGLQVGAVLAARTPEGGVVPMTVREIKEKTVVMDMNHPMAGKTLVFDVKIVDIQPAPPSKPAEPAKPNAPAQGAKPAEPAKK
ncbi:MAG TPA: peptidylprolyl isomerase [Candidatus Binatia bacterium]|jgi:FKBP-type peptidyl-prolyl cis-trans isomerase SlyD